MGQLRTMLRMAGHDGTRSPAAVLSDVDLACATFGQTVFATALIARVGGPDGDWGAQDRAVTWSSAGHPPPLLVHRDGRVEVLAAPVGLPLGVDPRAGRPEHRVVVPPAATLLLYTDGLLEQHGPVGKRPAVRGSGTVADGRDLDAGLARLTALLAECAGLELEALCDRITADLLPAAGAADDVALIAIRPLPGSGP